MYKLDSGNVLTFDPNYIIISIPEKYSLSFIFNSEILMLSPSEKLFIYSAGLSKITINMLTSDILIETKRINQRTMKIEDRKYTDKITYPHSLISAMLDKEVIKTKNYMVQNLLEAKKIKKGIASTDITIKRIALFGPAEKKITRLFEVYKTCNNNKRHHICDINDARLVFNKSL